MNAMARSDSEGLPVLYRVLYRIRYLGLHVFGPAQLGASDDPHARLRRERQRKVAKARQERQARDARDARPS